MPAPTYSTASVEELLRLRQSAREAYAALSRLILVADQRVDPYGDVRTPVNRAVVDLGDALDRIDERVAVAARRPEVAPLTVEEVSGA